jgi:hypothetical protein
MHTDLRKGVIDIHALFIFLQVICMIENTSLACPHTPPHPNHLMKTKMLDSSSNSTSMYNLLGVCLFQKLGSSSF